MHMRICTYLIICCTLVDLYESKAPFEHEAKADFHSFCPRKPDTGPATLKNIRDREQVRHITLDVPSCAMLAAAEQREQRDRRNFSFHLIVLS